MRPTVFGSFVRDGLAPVQRQDDQSCADALAHVQGRRHQLRIGYAGLAAARFLHPALTKLRPEFPWLRVLPFDPTPREQLEAVRTGGLNVAVVGQEEAAIVADGYRCQAARLGVVAVLPADYPRATGGGLALAELRRERFAGVDGPGGAGAQRQDRRTLCAGRIPPAVRRRDRKHPGDLRPGGGGRGGGVVARLSGGTGARPVRCTPA